MSYDSGATTIRMPQHAAPFRSRLVALAAAAACLVPLAAWPQAGTPPQAPQPQPPAASASAEPPFTLKDAVQRAVLQNPEVLARWHAIRAAEGERDAARGGLLPRVDISAAYGPERRSLLGNYGRRTATVSLTQLLYDGYATYGEFQRLDHTTKVRLFEFFEIAESVALEAARAYIDVVRYRELVRLAEDNFVEHRAVYAQIERRVTARIARAVDLEQVTGRLALAEANLLTEVANLHDTSARFQRIVGRVPPMQMPLPPRLDRDMPADMQAAVTRAQAGHPSLLASIESVRASQAALSTRKGAYSPRVDLRLRHDQGANHAGALGHSRTTAAELVLSWNLFNGFADQARERQFVSQLNVASELRDKTCRDLRQTVMIAYNDVGKLLEQLDHLRQHAAAVEKALVAYRLQFDIGQRTLLDLLDTENELFQARRAVVNAEQDLALAYARTHAGMGRLLRALDLSTSKEGDEAEIQRWTMGDDGARSCPVEPIQVPVVEREELIRRAVVASARLATLNSRERAIQESAVIVQRAPEAQPGLPPVPGASTLAGIPGAAVTAPGAAPVPPVPAGDPAALEPAVRLALEDWRNAWSARDLDAYLASYAPGFTPADGSARDAWEKRRRQVIGRSADVQVTLQDVRVSVEGADRATTTFVQQYRSASYRDTVSKTLQWQLVDGRWRITSEMQAPVPAR